jgi:hypothetical protein
VSAVPEDFMSSPDDREPQGAAPPPAEEEAAENFWQWVALIVLLGCWLAEASMCAPNS